MDLHDAADQVEDIGGECRGRLSFWASRILLTEAAALYGACPWQAFRRIQIPLAVPDVMAKDGSSL